jgi:hypothetical protein
MAQGRVSATGSRSSAVSAHWRFQAHSPSVIGNVTCLSDVLEPMKNRLALWCG